MYCNTRVLKKSVNNLMKKINSSTKLTKYNGDKYDPPYTPN